MWCIAGHKAVAFLYFQYDGAAQDAARLFFWLLLDTYFVDGRLAGKVKRSLLPLPADEPETSAKKQQMGSYSKRKAIVPPMTYDKRTQQKQACSCTPLRTFAGKQASAGYSDGQWKK